LPGQALASGALLTSSSSTSTTSTHSASRARLAPLPLIRRHRRRIRIVVLRALGRRIGRCGWGAAMSTTERGAHRECQAYDTEVIAAIGTYASGMGGRREVVVLRGASATRLVVDRAEDGDA